ncbi:MAG: PAS domain-containing protein, partial [Chloroflexota bacterium]|nr:PAS domain-containing protein [Chloroflexota bacterium]
MAHAIAPTELRDINERLLIAGLREQELAAELRRQLAFTSAITRSLGEGVCALDRDGRVTFANTAATRLLDWPEADLSGRDLHQLIHVDCADNCPLRNAIRASAAYRNDDDVFICRDGTVIPVAYSVAPIESNSMPFGVVLAFRDTTERKRLMHHEQVARAEAEASLRIRTELLEMVAHDLRTPLTAIKGTAQLLARKISAGSTTSERLEDGLKTIDTAASRMMAILAELLDVAQLQSGQSLALVLRPMDLVGLVRKAVAEQQSTTSHRITVETTEQALPGTWDASRLERALANLLSNADKYSHSDHSISLRLSRDETPGTGGWAVLAIHDDGIGIPAADLPRIFERFRRGS